MWLKIADDEATISLLYNALVDIGKHRAADYVGQLLFCILTKIYHFNVVERMLPQIKSKIL